MRTALVDLLDHIVTSEKLSEKEKKKKMKKFKVSYPDIYFERFKTPEEEPAYMIKKKVQANVKSSTTIERFASLSRLKSAIRL